MIEISREEAEVLVAAIGNITYSVEQDITIDEFVTLWSVYDQLKEYVNEERQ